ncbi:MBL fold metallo-hydrolase [uncultured Nocardioides sp.]|uniref:MBL fold metallo-hydrolase n=1 Tax=uncultured Nocardioides sp. TaxID=198441 RepID=UPI0025DC6B5B|nr:MBL fold metallo-hydrolase [uncultured Nocardioides sp.]
MAGQPTVELAPGVWRVPLVRDLVNGFILRDADGQVTLLDMGLRSSGPKVLAALESIGSGTADVTRLLLTHAHLDHAGGAAHVAEATGLGVGVHTDDASYVRAGQSAPQDSSAGLGRLLSRISPPPTFGAVPVEEELTDGQVLPVAGGLRVVHTPGHSPGHASFLHEETRTLITGDSIFNVLGLRWPVKWLCTDFRLTKQTAHRLADLEYDVAAFTHGPEIRDAPRAHIRRFLARHPV